MLAAPDALYPQFASHNAFTIAAIHTLAGDADYEFQCLHGMGEISLRPGRRRRTSSIARAGSTRRSGRTKRCSPISCAGCSRTAPTRSFVNRIVDPAVQHRRAGRRSGRACAQHRRRRRIRASPLPDRAAVRIGANSQRPRSCPTTPCCAICELQLGGEPPQLRDAAPILAAQRRIARARGVAIVNPGDHRDVVGTVDEADAADVAHAVAMAAASRVGVVDVAGRRARRLPRARGRSARGRAPALRRCSPCAKRARRSPTPSAKCARRPTSCRYYAAQARRELEGSDAARADRRASRRGIFRWRSSPGRSAPRWPPATRCSRSPPSRRR